MLFVIKVFVARKWKCKIGRHGFQTKSSHTEVDDEDLKQVEDGGQGLRRLPQGEKVKFGIGKFDMWHFKSLQCIAMGKKVAKIGDPQ